MLVPLLTLFSGSLQLRHEDGCISRHELATPKFFSSTADLVKELSHG